MPSGFISLYYVKYIIDMRFSTRIKITFARTHKSLFLHLSYQEKIIR